ncbi:hypothetical protein M0R45_020680 [Rubus argutus]|uniref:BHLH domain-containing protein n=1 Tax=Rubus argutus TaxID=59490 RepID=A0AAW1XAS6_RUBAR
MSHIAVERNRRKQMNEHLKVLRSLTPCFYIKRGDQASIIGGVIEFIKELHQELGACCNSPVADVEAKISGSNVVLKIISRRTPGQVVKIISVLERSSFEVLHLNISSMEETVLYSFVIKIGLECQLSVEELVFEVQQTLRSDDTA